MARRSGASSLSVYNFAPGQVITAQDLSDVHAAQNYAKVNQRETLVSMSSGDFGGEFLSSFTSGVYTSVARCSVYIKPDLVTLTMFSIAFDPAVGVDTEVILGSASAVVFSTSLESGTALQVGSQTFSTASTGTGWQFMSVRVAPNANANPQYRGFSLITNPLSLVSQVVNAQ